MNSEIENLFELVKNNKIEDIKKVLQKDPALIEKAKEGGVYAIYIASEYGHFELVKYIIEYTRTSMNIWDDFHRTALHYAAKGNNKELFRYLVERISLNPLEVDMDLRTPLDYAREFGADNIIEYYKNELSIEDLYRNPIISGSFPDPSFIRVEDDYYMVTSSFIYFPCIPILHSKDLVNWKIIGHAVTDPSYIDLSNMDNGRGFWAPDISYNNGKFYITATYRLNDDEEKIRYQMVVSSDKPEGPYCKPTFIDEDGIDPSIFTDDDGRRYMLLNRGARIFEINEEGTEKIGEQKMLWYGNNKRAPEAPHLLKKDGYYYLFVSEGGTGRGHQISVSRSKELMGVYENCPFNPILTQRDENHPIQRSGHGKMLQTQTGEWYIAYLCGRMIDQKWSVLGRETALDKVTWIDGWPVVNNLKGPSGAGVVPNIPKDVKPKTFDYKGIFGLDCDFHFARNPVGEYLEVNGNEIKYTAGNKDLSEMNSRNVICQRQTSFKFNASVEIFIDKNDMKENDEASLICYYDTNSYAKYSIIKKSDDIRLRLTEKIGLDIIEHDFVEIDYNGDITLSVDTDYLSRRFSYKTNGEFIETNVLDDTTYLSDEGVKIGKRFTGAMVGMFALSSDDRNEFKPIFRNFTKKDL